MDFFRDRRKSIPFMFLMVSIPARAIRGNKMNALEKTEIATIVAQVVTTILSQKENKIKVQRKATSKGKSKVPKLNGAGTSRVTSNAKQLTGLQWLNGKMNSNGFTQEAKVDGTYTRKDGQVIPTLDVTYSNGKTYQVTEAGRSFAKRV